MAGHCDQCIERYCELAGVDRKSIGTALTPCIDDHALSPKDFEPKGELSDDASKIVLKGLYVARLQRVDLIWSVNTMAREVTRWNIACDKRLKKMIQYINGSRDMKMICFVGDAENCCIVMFTDASFAGDLRDSKATSGIFVAIIGPNTFVPISWICKKQGAVSHSSAEAEIISLEFGVRTEGLPMLGLWGEVINVFSLPSPMPKKNKMVKSHPS